MAAASRRTTLTGGVGLSGKREPVYRVIEHTVIPMLGLWFRWTIEGVDNIPGTGPAILAFNHIAYLDALAVGYIVTRAGRRPRFLTKSELFRDGRIGWALRATGQIEVKRGTVRAPAALAQAKEALERGEIVVIFPEGTVTTDPDLKPMAAKSGVVRLALESRAPLIPCGLWGTANVWPKGSYRKRWRPGQDIVARIGTPMMVEGDAGLPRDWRSSGVRIMDEISSIVAGLRPAVPDSRRPLEKSA